MTDSRSRVSAAQTLSRTKCSSGLRSVFSSRLVQDCSSGSDNLGLSDSNSIGDDSYIGHLEPSRSAAPGPYRRFWATESPSGSSFDKPHADANGSSGNSGANIRPRPRRSSTAPNPKAFPSHAGSTRGHGLHTEEDSGDVVVFGSETSGNGGLDRALVSWGKAMGNPSAGQQQLQRLQRRMGIPGIMDREHQSRVLFVSLLENYCQTYDDDPLRNRRLFFTICRTLFSMGIIGKEYVDEMASIRSTYSDAFRQLVAKAQESLNMYEHYDIESGIRTLMTGVEEDSADSYGLPESAADELSEYSGADGGLLSQSPLAASEDDGCANGVGRRRYTSMPASRGAAWLSGHGRSSVNSLRSSNASSRGFASATAAASSFRDSSISIMKRNQSAGQPLGRHRRNLSRLSRGSVSVSPGTTFGTMVMDMQRSRYHDDFVQLRCLGKGGFGKVYEVRNKLDGRRYAVKLIKIKGEITADKTLREIKTLANLDHPNIVRYYSSWIEVTRVRHKSPANGCGSAKSQSSMFSFYDRAGGGMGFIEKYTSDEPATGDPQDIFDDEEAAVVAQVSIGHSSVPKSWSVEAASNIVFEQSGENNKAPAGEESQEDNKEVEEEGGDDDEEEEQADADWGCEPSESSRDVSDCAAFCDDDDDDDSYDCGVVFAYEDSVCQEKASGFPCISEGSSASSCQSENLLSSDYGISGSSDEDSSDGDSESEGNAGYEVAARVGRADPIPIKRPSAHRRRRSVHAPVGPFTPSGDSANLYSGSRSARAYGSQPSQAQSLPSQSMDFGTFLVAETTLFVQMQLCQTTLQEFLAQRNARIAERLSQHDGCSDDCDLWEMHEPHRLIDPVLNVRLFRSIVEAVKYFHTRGVIHRDLKGANVFLDIVYADSGGNPLSRSASGIGRPSDGCLPQGHQQRRTGIPGGSSVVPVSMASSSGLGNVHSDAWDAIDGGNLKEQADALSDVAGASGGSRKIDWDAVFESMQTT
ncbi:hypothetical protein LPJ56_002516, partial [Coemansia sp. RSA 2599]